jgi:ATP-dependent Clp protease ATP-binding subunit ClpC
MLTLNIDNDTREILQMAMTTAQDLGREYCTSGDLLLAISGHSRGQEELLNIGLDERAISLIPGAVLHTPNNEERGRFRLSDALLSALTRAEEFSEVSEEHELRVLTLKSTLFGLLSGDSLAHEVLSRLGVPELDPLTVDEIDGSEIVNPFSNENLATPVLNQFAIDLTAEAHAARLDPVIGRDEEIHQLIEILSRRKKNNAAVIGEAGVGKTAVVEGLANKIAVGEAPALSDARVVALDMNRLMAGSGMRGALEERLGEIINEVQNCDQEIIVFIDEAHSLVGGNGPGADNGQIGDILKPALARGQFRVVAATTFAEYRQIERDAALSRRFSAVKLEEPDRQDLFFILNGIKDNYAEFHNVEISNEAIEACIDLSTRYLAEGKQPDKAIDLLDTAAAKVRVAKATEIDAAVNRRLVEIQDDPDSDIPAELEAVASGFGPGQVEASIVSTVVSERTGIPVGSLVQDERQAILGVEETLSKRIVGHQEVIEKVAAALRASRAGIRDESRPIGTFMFSGPTGVGKTEMAKALAEEIFGSEKALVRIDMSEYRAEFSISRLIGSPPGYVGYGRGGELTEAVFRRPYSVVLFDEVEKAHPDVLNTLLQILDDGRLTDSEGKVVDFTNTVVIMTSNVGSRESNKTGIGFVEQSAPEERIDQAIQRAFLPEFLNRIDYVANFSALGPEEIKAIAAKMIDELIARVGNQGINLVVEPPVIEHLAQLGYSPAMGARNMNRTIRDSLEQALAPVILDPETPAGATLTVHLNSGGEIKIRRRKR